MKGEAHKFITEKVLKYFAEEFQFSENEIYWIARGTNMEDYMPLTSRLFKWHFYRSNSFIKKHIGLGVNPTSETRLKTLIARIKWPWGDENKAEMLGNIIHHIQDMSTPTHVVPIYHGPDLKSPKLKILDPYEEYMMDKIKEMDFLSTIDQSITPRDWFDIYDSTAKLSLEYLANEKVPMKNEYLTMKFSQIWTPYPLTKKGKYKGFGDFGKHFDCFNTNKKATHIDIDAIYKHFTTQAAQTTYEALKCYVEKFKNR